MQLFASFLFDGLRVGLEGIDLSCVVIILFLQAVNFFLQALVLGEPLQRDVDRTGEPLRIVVEASPTISAAIFRNDSSGTAIGALRASSIAANAA